MNSDDGSTSRDDKPQYIPMEKRVIKTAGKGCLITLATMIGIGLVLEFGFGQAISMIWCLIGLYTLLVVTPKNIIPEAKHTGSTTKGIIAVSVGIIIAVIWASVVTQFGSIGLGTGITVGLLIQWGFIFVLSHIIARVIWAVIQTKTGNKATQTTSSVTKSLKPTYEESNLVTVEKHESMNTELSEEKITKLAKKFTVLNKVDDTLYQSNIPEDEINLAEKTIDRPSEKLKMILPKVEALILSANCSNTVVQMGLETIKLNCREAISSLEKGVDVTKTSITTREVGKGLRLLWINFAVGWIDIVKSKMSGAEHQKLIDILEQIKIIANELEN